MVSGQIIAGKYRLNELLGRGGMADVWSASHQFTERDVAIKFMSPHVAKTDDAALRFLKEAKVSARVNHPNVIEIHDVGQTEEGQLFLVMELLQGASLDVALRHESPPMTVCEFTRLMAEISDALAAAHRSGVVHRDLKPSNLFLQSGRDGVSTLTLLDFGVSKFVEDGRDTALTGAGTVLGSPLYMSPEQARGDAGLDGRTDVFAFGAILFEAFCGYRAYNARNFNALILTTATTNPKSIDACAPLLPESLRSIVRGCLEVDVTARTQTFNEVTARLREATRELSDSRMRLPPPAPSFEPLHSANHPYSPTPREGQRSGADGAWQTPPSSCVSRGPSAPKVIRRQWLRTGMVLVLGFLGLGVGVRLAWIVQRGGTALADRMARGPVAARVTPAAMPMQAAKPLPVTFEPTPVLRSISVDSLPRASSPSGAIPRGFGRVRVTASAGGCAVTVDGFELGRTPTAGIDLPKGAHMLRCDAVGGRIMTQIIVVKESEISLISLSPEG